MNAPGDEDNIRLGSKSEELALSTIGLRPRRFRSTISPATRAITTTAAMYPNNDTSASGSGCASRRTSMMLEEEIKLHRFAGISPEQSFTEAGRQREAMVAAD
jgi:hypothetical protein